MTERSIGSINTPTSQEQAQKGKVYNRFRTPYRQDLLPSGLHWSKAMPTSTLVKGIPSFHDDELETLKEVKIDEVREISQNAASHKSLKDVIEFGDDHYLHLILSATSFISAVRSQGDSAYRKYNPDNLRLSYAQARDRTRKVIRICSSRKDISLFDIFKETLEFLEKESELVT